ncbi:MAG: DUF4116 domain-containing protein [Marivivens sp.]|nr:DUF4116 domain-containing protein [Marivivens sp.]
MIDENSTKKEMLEAVRRNGYALQLASEELKNDREVVLQALRQNIYALEYVSDELQLEIVNCWAKSVEEKNAR